MSQIQYDFRHANGYNCVLHLIKYEISNYAVHNRPQNNAIRHLQTPMNKILHFVELGGNNNIVYFAFASICHVNVTIVLSNRHRTVPDGFCRFRKVSCPMCHHPSHQTPHNELLI